MAFKLSTGLRNALMGERDTIVGTDLKITGATTITSTAGALLTTGFRPGDIILLSGWPIAGNNTGIYTLGTVAAGTMAVSGTALSIEDGDADSTITAVSKGFKDIFKNCVIRVYSGTEPADADADEGSGTLLLEITKDSAVLTPGAAANGLNFAAIVAGVLSKNTDVWSDAGLANGTAAWYRLYDNGRITGASETAKRCQGTISTSGTTFILSSTSIKLGATTTLDTADFTMPAS